MRGCFIYKCVWMVSVDNRMLIAERDLFDASYCDEGCRRSSHDTLLEPCFSTDRIVATQLEVRFEAKHHVKWGRKGEQKRRQQEETRASAKGGRRRPKYEAHP